MKKLYIGIDNGSTGALGFINTVTNEVGLYPMPTVFGQDYTKAKKNITRVDFNRLIDLLGSWVSDIRNTEIHVVLERPMVNPSFFTTSIAAVRVFEATLVALEHFMLPYEMLDSRSWQRDILVAGLKGEAELKQGSLDTGMRLFPTLREAIFKQKDADAILMAEYARRKQL